MKRYTLSLARGYKVEVSAENEEDAKRYAEFFIGGERDLSNDEDKFHRQFEITQIEMTANDAVIVEKNEK